MPPEMTIWPEWICTEKFLQRFQKAEHMPEASFRRLPVDEVPDARMGQMDYIRYVLLHLFHGRTIEHAGGELYTGGDARRFGVAAQLAQAALFENPRFVALLLERVVKRG